MCEVSQLSYSNCSIEQIISGFQEVLNLRIECYSAQ